MNTIAVLVAMQEEMDAILPLFENCEKTELYDMPVYSTKIGHRRFIFALSGVGRTNTAINTSLIINHFKPTAVINIGSAGGLLQTQKILDVVIPSEVVAVDIDVTALGFEYGVIIGGQKSYFADKNLCEELTMLSVENNIATHSGIIGSSEAFICKPEQVTEIHRRFGENKVACVEMEAFSVAVACDRFKVPFAVIRSLSDVPAHGEGNELHFNEFLKKASGNAAKILHAYASTDIY
jgi:adenosylhomocysteine nucleosidase